MSERRKRSFDRSCSSDWKLGALPNVNIVKLNSTIGTSCAQELMGNLTPNKLKSLTNTKPSTKKLFAELCKIFIECGPDCIICDQFIRMFTQHLQEVHVQTFPTPTDSHSGVELVSVQLSPKKARHIEVQIANKSTTVDTVRQEESDSIISENRDFLVSEIVALSNPEVEEILGLESVEFGVVEVIVEPHPDVDDHYAPLDSGTASDDDIDDDIGHESNETEATIPHPTPSERVSRKEKETSHDRDQEIRNSITSPGIEISENNHPPKCGICSSSLRDFDDVVHHLKSAHTSIPFAIERCKTCHMRYLDITESKDGKRSKSMITSHRCLKILKISVKSETGQTDGDVDDEFHMDSKSPNKITKSGAKSDSSGKDHSCEVCGKGFPTKIRLTLHMICHSSEKPHRCRQCGRCFARPHELVRHGRVHSTAGKRKAQTSRHNKCKICGKTYAYKEPLMEHLRTIHLPLIEAQPGGGEEKGGQPHVCDLCGKGFAHKSRLKMHMLCHSGERPHCCNQCGKSFARVHDLVTHSAVHSEERPFKCDKCEKCFSRRGALTVHVSTVHDKVQLEEDRPRPHFCEDCGKQFVLMSQLKKHMICHTGERPHCCDQCGKTFARIHDLVKHGAVHNEERPFKCDQCGKSFVRNVTLTTHISTVHAKVQLLEQDRPHVCEDCGKQFVLMTQLRKHMVCHSSERPHCCDLCGKTFARPHDLIQHAKSHRTDRPFMCDDCGKDFTQEGLLKSHKLNMHTVPDVLYTCELCQRSFKKVALLETHKRLHTDERPFACDECPKKFNRKQQLDRHKVEHTGIRRFPCDHCERSFFTKQKLVQHLPVHTRETDTPFSCQMCDKAFAWKQGLKRHMRKCHE